MDSISEHKKLFETCILMPKIELHAHLTGSVRVSTVLELLESPKDKEDFSFLANKQKSLKECFSMFDFIYKITKSLDVISRITREMLEDWSKSNCLYLEIRTTLKEIGSKSKLDYTLTILNEIKQFNKDRLANPKDMQTRLILSFNRKLPIEDAISTLDVYKTIKSSQPEDISKLIVGVDYCGLEGNDLLNEDNLYSILNESRELGLKTTVHIGEVENYSKWDMSKHRPDRFGHTDYLSDEDTMEIIENHIPYECCPSSSYNRLGCYSYSQVNFRKYYKKTDSKGREYVKYSFNTDDTTLFMNDLSQEYYEIASSFGISSDEIRRISIRVSDDIFDEDYKQTLKSRMSKY